MRRNEIIHEAALEGRDSPSRRLLLGLGVIAAVSIAAAILFGVLWAQDKQNQVDASAGVVNTVVDACKDEDAKTQLATLGIECQKAETANEVIKEGPQGIPGVAGIAGKQGEKGDDGQPGEDGSDGADGDPGSDGVDGDDGTDGSPGPAGAPGSQGIQGEPGPAGAQGLPGPEGSPGPQGAEGPPGPKGFPFLFTFTVPADPPFTQERTYQVNCTEANAETGCTVTPVE